MFFEKICTCANNLLVCTHVFIVGFFFFFLILVTNPCLSMNMVY
jgi:hypothetical protein